MEDYSPTFEKAHATAQRLMNDEFFFDVLSETAPFGSDDGADAYAAFAAWRATNTTKSPVLFIHKQIETWDYPEFDIQEIAYEKLAPYLAQSDMAYRYMSGINAAIVAVAFGQLYLEGKVDGDVKQLAKVAVERELLPEILALWDEYIAERERGLNKLLAVLQRV
ncbi:hypothetical protein [Chitinophaga varians]|uniref:hypothetical protein n=1 Tax=Chitinophaga varians TaxID=2202339 RepID=UPI00165F031D|nr:hypothetical protein [Chitinophaga varians]MBC9914982.1 hypothetical protein [Chitinophaga varians]